MVWSVSSCWYNGCYKPTSTPVQLVYFDTLSWLVNCVIVILNYLAFQVRTDWETTKIDVMYRAIKCKFATYPSLTNMLLSTVGSVLVEASPHDLFWGGGREGEGLNYLGRLLMQLRSEILGTLPASVKAEDAAWFAGEAILFSKRTDCVIRLGWLVVDCKSKRNWDFVKLSMLGFPFRFSYPKVMLPWPE